MARRRGVLLVVGMLAMSFAGGMLANLLVGGSVAVAQVDVLPMRVQSVTIVDAGGRDRGTFGMLADGPGLTMQDEEGRTRAILGYIKEGDQGLWGVRFLDAGGVSRIGWNLRADGRGAGGHMQNSKGVLLVGFGADEVAGTGLTLNNAEGKQVIGIGVGPGGGGDLSLKDPFTGQTIWQASKAAQGGYYPAPAAKP